MVNMFNNINIWCPPTFFYDYDNAINNDDDKSINYLLEKAIDKLR